ncbi:hypothetical protein CHS0354_006727 [Potamilus streckersoni]|uniref:Tubulin polyglutamylase TTLL2 n=1 Tax=Potamilus streckersoni TaxID=2493646 RepID=A0AAE0RR33_9BIVA|nr:hypothetical protein CHS0354_006727 [Potamilus streckersoni]
MSDGRTRAFIFRINDGGSGPEILRQVFLERGWVEFDEEIQDDSDWNIWWKTSRFRISDYDNLAVWQRLNHYPKSTGITRKDCLARNLKRMKGVHGAGVYNFSPLSFNLPNDYTRFVAEYGLLKQKNDSKDLLWIFKPADLSRGRGIFIFRDISELQYDCNAVVQSYITNPLLIGGYKFDMRIYVAVPSFHPLTIYICQEGIVRFSTEKFDLKCLQNIFSHLTNTSINKYSPSYTTEKERVGPGCKWTLTQLRYFLQQDNRDNSMLWTKMINIVILTILIQAPQVPKVNNCFELYGFDILIDENMKPWLLEVNFSPALSIDCQVDTIVKKPMLHDLMKMMNFKESDMDRGRQNSSSEHTLKNFHQFDRNMPESHLKDWMRTNTTVKSISRQPSMVCESLSYIEDIIVQSDDKLCFGLPLVHPLDDEKASCVSSGHSSAKSEELELLQCTARQPSVSRSFNPHSSREQTSPMTDRSSLSIYGGSTISPVVRRPSGFHVHQYQKYSNRSGNNSDSAISSFSGSSDNSEKISLNASNQKHHSQSGTRPDRKLSTHSLKDSEVFTIKSLSQTSENSRSLQRIARALSPLRNVGSKLSKSPLLSKGKLSLTRTEDEARKENPLKVSSKHSIKTMKDTDTLNIDVKSQKNGTTSRLLNRAQSKSVSILLNKPKPKGPPPKIGDFFLVFPFNEATFKSAKSTLDPHVIIRESQKLLKEKMLQVEKMAEKRPLGHLPYGSSPDGERMWGPVKVPPEKK